MTSSYQNLATSVQLGSLAAELVGIEASAMTVTGIQLDSRKVKSGDLFLACNGSQFKGRDFIGQAISSGARAVLLESEQEAVDMYFEGSVPVIPLQNLSVRSGEIAAEFYGKPSAQIELFGVTGTNGKTTCSQIVAQLCRGIFGSCGVIGTMGNSLDGSVSKALNTTPDGVTLQALLADWVGHGVSHVAMEVSSHALQQGRTSGLYFDTAILTNLSRDHLDYHGDMASYAAAKARLFNVPGLKRAVLNIDDVFGRELLTDLTDRLEVYTYSLERPEADIFAESVEFAFGHIEAKIRSPWGQFDIQAPLLGSFNLSNVLACIGALGVTGATSKQIASNIRRLEPVAGRMQLLPNTEGLQVVVDYAHTPAALEQALKALRFHCENRLLCVFGCGGDRDAGKRAEMGAVASDLADVIVITSDNPRSEKPEEIIEQIAAGCANDVLIEVDRAKAITMALALAQPGDTVLIAGKGHEQYQLINGEQLAFSDVAQVATVFNASSKEDCL